MVATRPEPRRSARKAGLLYVSDEGPGIRRLRSGKGFRYVDAKGRSVRSETVLRRIRRLAIPPAWTDVWICPKENGHVQATGRDARGRKQHRYHADWRETRDATKYERVLDFAKRLPRIRRRVAKDLRHAGLGRERVLATIVRLMDVTYLRVGNEEYARANHSYGLTTLRDRHAKVRGGRLRLHFRGKSGKEHEIELADKRLARIVRGCQDLPGQVLFQYLDEDGAQHELNSRDVNDYLREAAGADFTARDFRTWAGTVLAMQELEKLAFESEADAKRNIVEAVGRVASRLGNTVAVCRKCYIHPSVLEGYADGRLGGKRRAAKQTAVATRAASATKRSAGSKRGKSSRSVAAYGAKRVRGAKDEAAIELRPHRSASLDPEEKAVLHFLQCCRRERKRR